MSQANRILSGVQPTGNLHLGNYLGAIRNWVALQDSHECLFMLADLHAITVPQDPDKLRASVRETAAAYIACGVNPDKSAIFHQSAVSAHAELGWILSCHTPLGWLNRMTQFKEKRVSFKFKKGINDEKSAELIEAIRKVVIFDDQKAKVKFHDDISDELQKEFLDSVEKVLTPASNLGLYSYPVLMAADILVYKATHVPVGHDQKQHLELCRDIAGAFNRAYNPSYNVKDNKGGFFPLPEPVIMGEGTRVMSLKDGTK